MTILQGISQSMKTLAGSNTAEDFSRMGAVLAQLKGKIREEMQAATAGDITKILKKLEAGQSLTPEEKDNVGLWVVGDAVGYTKMENDFQHWLTEFKRLGGALEAYEIQDKSPQMLMEMHGLLEDAVRLQLRADVPIGAHLSGGLDSSAVTSIASALLGTPVKTFSGGFRDKPQYDETPYARMVARQFDSEYHEVFPTAEDFVAVLERLIYHMDEPAAGPGVFPQYFVSKLASQHVKVVLGGQGGDETFGGYSRYLIAYLEECLKGGIQGVQDNSKYVVTFESILPNLQQLQGYEPLLGYFWEKGLFESEDRRYFRLVDRSNSTLDFINEEYLPRKNEYDLFETLLYP